MFADPRSIAAVVAPGRTIRAAISMRLPHGEAGTAHQTDLAH